MTNTNLSNIGLDKKSSDEIANHLNDVLSNYQMFYMNLRGFHWNIKGTFLNYTLNLRNCTMMH